MRTVTPFSLGMSRISVPLFVILNTAGALVWTIAISLVGYLLGQAAEAMLGNVKRYETMLLTGLAGIGAIVWLWHRLRHRNATKDD